MRAARVRLVAALAALVIAALAFAIGGQRALDGVQERRLGELRRELERAVEHGLSRHRVLQLELAQVAQQLARSPLTPRLGLVIDEEERLATLAARIRRAVPGPSDDPAVVRLRRARISLDDELVPGLARLWAARLGATPDAEASARAFVAECLAVDVDACLHLATREPLAAAVAALAPASGAASSGLDVALVVDARGIGRASVHDPAWTRVGGLAGELPILAEALTARAIVRDVGRVPGRDGVHLLVAAPLLEGDTLRGAVLVGVALGGRRLVADAAAIGHDLSWLIAGTLGPSASTLPAADQPELDGDRFVSVRAAVPGNVSTTPILVVSTRKDLVESALADARGALTWLAVAAAALLAVALTVLRGRL